MLEKFSYERDGYNRQEVNQFVNDVIARTEGIISRCNKQNAEIAKLRASLEYYKNLETGLYRSLVRSDEMANDIKKMAQEEAKVIIGEAKNNASKIVNDSLLRAAKIENRIDIIESNMRIFKKRLKLIMDEQKAVMDEIEVLELDPK